MGDFKNDFTWSKSRDSLFKRCYRAYYYNHYAFWGGWNPKSDPEVRELYIMKNLHSTATWVGSAVHDQIEKILKAFQRGQIVDKARGLAQLERQLRRDIDDSIQGNYRKNPKRIVGLQNHYYETPISDDDIESSIEMGLKCLTTFFESNVYKRILAVGPEAILSLEELESIKIDGHKVWVKLDLGMRGKKGGAVIVDWKTGKAHDASDIALQLGVYGLFGLEKWNLSPDEIIGFDFNLRLDEIRQHPIDAETLDEVKAYISESMTEMKSRLVDVDENIARIEDFEQTTQLHFCKTCNYRRACDRG